MMQDAKRRRTSLRVRILAWSFIPTTLILLAVALLILIAYQQVTEDLVAGRNREVTRFAANQLAADLQDYGRVLSSLAVSSDMRSQTPAKQQEALVAASNSLIVFDGGVLVLNSHGQVAAAQPARPDILGQDWSNRGYFRDMLRAKGLVLSDVTTDAPGGTRGLVIAVPILGDRGELLGMLAGLFRLGPGSLNAFYGGIVNLRIGQNGRTYLVDAAGQVIYHSDADLIGTNLHAEPVVQQVLAQQVGERRTNDAQGRSILASYAPVPGTGWGLVNEEDWSVLLTTGRTYGTLFVVLLALAVLVPVSVVSIGVNRITNPIRQVIAAAKEIAGGQYGRQVKVQTGDELEDLAEHFNLMSKELAESYGQLEARVAARTKELGTLNAVAEVVSGSLDLREIMRAALDKAMETMRMEVGTAYSLQEVEGEDGDKVLVLAARRGLPDEFFQRIGQRRLVGTAMELAATAEQPTVWPVDNYPDPSLKQALELEGVNQVINVPLLAKGKLVGAFNVGTRTARPVLPEEIALLASIGRQVAVAVENARLYDRAEQTAAMAERNRLSRELHDSVTQSLYSMNLYAEATARLLDAGDVSTAAMQLRELRDTAQEALREMRLLIFQLRLPVLGKSGLAVAIQQRLDSVERRSGIQCRMQVKGGDHLPVSVQEELYHIAQESLNNALKHAHARNIEIVLRLNDGEVCLEIADDGVGFDVDKAGRQGGMGFHGMRERAQKIGGRVDIRSTPGKGTRVTVTGKIGENE